MKKMNYLLIAFCAALLLVSTQVKAQATEDVEIIQQLWGKEKRAIITEYMKFTETEITKFAPIYDSYEMEYEKLGKQRLNLINEYINNYDKMTNEKADELMMKLLQNNAAIDALLLSYYNKFKEKISATRAAQFVQLELYLQTMVRAAMQSNIPMIGELNQTTK
jgi:hypothetical protein